MRHTLLQESPREGAAVLLAGHATQNNDTALLVREVIPVPTEAYMVQKPTRLEIQPAFLAPLIKRARNEGWSIILTHSHPFSSGADFSLADDEGEALMMPTLFARASNRPHGALVIGQTGFSARIRYAPDSCHRVTWIHEVGRNFLRHGAHSDGQEIKELDDRSVRAFGVAGQTLLRGLRIAIVGLGGTGSIVTEELAHLGVGELILMDPDDVEESNLNRLVGSSHPDIGKPKVDVAAALVRRIRPNIGVTAIRGSAVVRSEAKELLTADLILCCTDSQGSRTVLNQIAYQYYIPTIDLGVRIDATDDHVTTMVGRVQLLAPGLSCLVCQGLLDSEAVRRDLLSDYERRLDPYIVGAVEPQPAVISLNGVVASLAVTMLLATVTGISVEARHQVYLANRGTVRAIVSSPLENCIVCSNRGALGRGDNWPLPWRMV